MSQPGDAAAHAQQPAVAEWRLPPRDLVLRSEEIHVWRVSVAQHVCARSELRSVLSPEERDREARFHFAADRDQFLVAHGLLRVLIGRYLGEEPQQLLFAQGSYGKPTLDLSAKKTDLRFNLSHSKGLVLCAVAKGREVGVDVEHIHHMADFQRIAEKYFSPAEQAELAASPAESRLVGFFEIWTLKEAFLKARGLGLSGLLSGFSVSRTPDESGNCLAHSSDGGDVAGWSLQRLSPGPGYVGALAGEGRDWRLVCWDDGVLFPASWDLTLPARVD